jgi:hypothetical protein
MKGDVILRRGLPSLGIYFIIKGEITVYYKETNYNIQKLSPGDSFGDICLLGRRSHVTFQASTDAACLFLSDQNLKDHLKLNYLDEDLLKKRAKMRLNYQEALIRPIKNKFNIDQQIRGAAKKHTEFDLGALLNPISKIQLSSELKRKSVVRQENPIISNNGNEEEDPLKDPNLTVGHSKIIRATSRNNSRIGPTAEEDEDDENSKLQKVVNIFAASRRESIMKEGFEHISRENSQAKITKSPLLHSSSKLIPGQLIQVPQYSKDAEKLTALPNSTSPRHFPAANLHTHSLADDFMRKEHMELMQERKEGLSPVHTKVQAVKNMALGQEAQKNLEGSGNQIHFMSVGAAEVIHSPETGSL